MANVDVSTVDGQCSPYVLAMNGEFDLSNVELVEDFLTLWVAQGRREAVIDMGQTRYIDSSVIGVLITAQIAGLRLTVRGASEAVHRALEMTGL